MKTEVVQALDTIKMVPLGELTEKEIDCLIQRLRSLDEDQRSLDVAAFQSFI